MVSIFWLLMRNAVLYAESKNLLGSNAVGLLFLCDRVPMLIASLNRVFAVFDFKDAWNCRNEVVEIVTIVTVYQ